MTPDQTRLLELFAALSAREQHSVLDFVDYLRARAQDQDTGLPAVTATIATPAQIKAEEPTATIIARPAQESVMAALKRLSQSYTMLDKSKLFNETSGLVTQHIMQSRDPVEVIDELEAIFVRHYRVWRGDERQD